MTGITINKYSGKATIYDLRDEAQAILFADAKSDIYFKKTFLLFNDAEEWGRDQAEFLSLDTKDRLYVNHLGNIDKSLNKLNETFQSFLKLITNEIS